MKESFTWYLRRKFVNKTLAEKKRLTNRILEDLDTILSPLVFDNSDEDVDAFIRQDEIINSDVIYNDFADDKEQRILAWRKHYEEQDYVFFDNIIEQDDSPLFGRTDLHNAVANNDLEQVKIITQTTISNGGNIHLKDNNNMTPLELAKLEEYTDIINYLSQY